MEGPRYVIHRALARYRRSWLVRKIVRVCHSIIHCNENLNYAIAVNGERWVLERLSLQPIQCIFDVGANAGDWAMTAHAVFPQAAIHCFEIMPSTFAKLRRRVDGVKEVHVNDFGLSDREGTTALRFFENDDTHSTLTPFPRTTPGVEVEVKISTGDAYVERCGINRIDFLKIDVEGAENNVLAGFSKTIAAGRVDVVQFEYGPINIVTKFLLRDFYEFFDRHGYDVGKIYPNYVDFRPYAFEHEDFLGPNYLAVRRSRGDLIRLVAN